MANTAAADPHVPAACSDDDDAPTDAAASESRVRPQLIAYAVVFLVSTAESIVINYGSANPSGGNNGSRAGGDEPAYALLAFLLSLLGIWLVLLALVADRVLAAATHGEGARLYIAMALRGYFFGGRRN